MCVKRVSAYSTEISCFLVNILLTFLGRANVHPVLQKIRAIATDRRRSICLCVSVCLSVCWSRSWALRKRLNRSRCRLGLTHVGPRNNVLDGVKVGRIHSPLRGVTRWRCGLSSKCLDHLSVLSWYALAITETYSVDNTLSKKWHVSK